LLFSAIIWTSFLYNNSKVNNVSDDFHFHFNGSNLVVVRV